MGIYLTEDEKLVSNIPPRIPSTMNQYDMRIMIISKFMKSHQKAPFLPSNLFYSTQKRPDWIVRPLNMSLKIILMLLKRQLLLIELLMLQLLL